MSNLRPVLLFCSMTSWDKQCTQSLFRNTHSVPATKISSYHIPCKLQKDSSAPAFHYTLYLVRSPVPSHGCRNLYRYDFSICFELFRITCQKNERRGKNTICQMERDFFTISSINTPTEKGQGQLLLDIKWLHFMASKQTHQVLMQKSVQETQALQPEFYNVPSLFK